MSKFLYKILFFILIFQIVYEPIALSNSAPPSDWAVDIIEQSKEEKLFDPFYYGNYSKSITRIEYVLFALDVLHKNGTNVVINNTIPFTDTITHPYSVQIAKAYSAGIISGYPNGEFRPDKIISRQEIAILVTNLFKVIQPDKSTTVQKEYSYSDTSDIATWAKLSVDFCFENNILKGVGTDTFGKAIINPKGVSTIEQAMVLLFNLAKNEGVLEKFQLPPLNTERKIGEEVIVTPTTTTNEYAATVGMDLFNITKEISETPSFALTELTENSAFIEVDENNSININKDDFFYRIELNLDEINNWEMLDKLMKTATTIDSSIDIRENFKNAWDKVQRQKLEYVFYEIDKENSIIINVKKNFVQGTQSYSITLVLANK
jgi:hypothetical protein